MLRLLLLRHAKSSWAESGIADRDRPLAPRGKRAAERMAIELSRQDYLPDRVLCSPARRTRETLKPLLPHLSDKNRVSIADELYEAAQDDYRDSIATFGGDARRLLVIGHNPTIHVTALHLVGAADQHAARRLATKFPTAALAVIDFEDGNWQQIRPNSGRLSGFIRPRDLEDQANNP